MRDIPDEMPLVFRTRQDGTWIRCDPETEEPYPVGHRSYAKGKIEDAVGDDRQPAK